MGSFRSRRSPRQRRDDRDSRRGARRPPCGGGRRQQSQPDPCGEQPPRDVRAVDAMVGRRLEARAPREPADQCHASSHHGRHESGDQAVGDRHQAQLPAGCTHRRQHPELTQPALGDDHETSGRHERHEQQRNRVQRQGGDDGWSAVRRGAALRQAVDTDRGRELPNRVGRRLVLVGVAAEQQVDLFRGARIARKREDELVVELSRVFDDTHNGPRLGEHGQLVADTHPEHGGHTVGHGHLAGLRRIVTVEQAQEWTAVETLRVFRAKVDGLHGTGHRQLCVPNHLDRCVLIGKFGDLGLQRRGIRAGQRDPALGAAELGRLGGCDVVRSDGREDGRRNRHTEQHEHDDLLAPFAPEHAPCPARYCAPAGDASSPTCSSLHIRCFEHRHVVGPGTSSDSGPWGAAV